jgi:hypothetical protein
MNILWLKGGRRVWAITRPIESIEIERTWSDILDDGFIVPVWAPGHRSQALLRRQEMDLHRLGEGGPDAESTTFLS